MKDKYIAVALALVVTFWVFFQPSLNSTSGITFAEKFTNFPLSVSLPTPTLDISGIANVGVGAEAWATFESYIVAAKAHDLDGIRALSHQVSPACSDTPITDDCIELMDSVVYFTEDWKQSDFVNVAYDDKQIVLSTNYIKNSDAVEGVKTVLYFTKNTFGEIKVLSIRFCLGDETSGECVETDPAGRDSDGNGWWDDVEALFRK